MHPTPDDAELLALPNSTDPTASASAPATAPADAATNVAVQTLRTSPCEEGGRFPHAPSGELTVLHAQIKAIKRARHYIYIEDQYFWVVDELREALYVSTSARYYVTTSPH